MKKSVILIISTLSLITIILIGLLFQRAEIYNVTHYVREIIVTNIRIGDVLYPTFYDSNQDLYLLVHPEKPGQPLTLRYQPELTLDILYAVSPYDATNADVSFFTDPNSYVASVDSETGRVVFKYNSEELYSQQGGTETFTLRANDNSNKSARVRIRAKP